MGLGVGGGVKWTGMLTLKFLLENIKLLLILP